MATKTIALANLKGGVGKTTTTMNLATELARQGYHVLVVDGDTQENGTQYAFGADATFPATLFDYMVNPRAFKFGQLARLYAGPQAENPYLRTRGSVAIIPGDQRLGFVEAEFLKQRSGQPVQMLHDTLAYGVEQLDGQMDYILFDPGPSWNAVTDAVLNAAHGVIVPFFPAPMTFLSFQMLLKTMADSNTRIHGAHAHPTRIAGVLFTMCHSKKQRQLAGALKGNFTRRGIHCFDPIINYTDATLEAVTERLPLTAYTQKHPEAFTNGDVTAQDVEDFTRLAQEVVEVTAAW